MTTVLLVEDEAAYVEALEVALQQDGFEVAAALDGRSALVEFDRVKPDVVLLDLMLPGLQGLDVLRTLRKTSNTPVIVVSAKDREADVVAALELGADDYVTKPYSLRELVARIRAAARRGRPDEQTGGLRRMGDVALDADRYELHVGAEVMQLPRKEFELLEILMAQPGRIATRAALLDEVWGHDWGESKSLDQHIRRLRRKLEQAEHGPTIQTVRGVGYRLEPPAD
ncbi:MAG: response regulator transcription factor [Acidimicrobiia bacterium]|nr:response regulator transcription factor [Acidimicrobiia bacterium]